MTIVITRPPVEPQVLKVDGHLSAEDTDVLLRACEGIARLVLDLSDLRSADRRGVGALRALISITRGDEPDVIVCTPQEGVGLAVQGRLALYATDEAVAREAARAGARGSETVH